MPILTASAGSYPRIGDALAQQRWRRAYAAFEVGAIAEGTFRTVEDQVAAEVVVEQLETGIDVVTDGLVRWYDPVSHTGRKLAGVTINGLLRWFDNNFYVRQPVIRDRITRVASIVAAEYRFAARKSPRPVKAVLTGPYTLARHSVIETPLYPDIAALTRAFADVLADEMDELQASGAAHVQIDEPALTRHPDDLPLVAEALGRIARAKVNVELTVALYHGDVTPLLRDAALLPADVVAVDVPSSPGILERLRAKPLPMGVALGVVDARSTRAEDVPALARAVAPVAAAARGPVYLAPSCGLEYLPRVHARQKLEAVAGLRGLIEGRRR